MRLWGRELKFKQSGILIAVFLFQLVQRNISSIPVLHLYWILFLTAGLGIFTDAHWSIDTRKFDSGISSQRDENCDDQLK